MTEYRQTRAIGLIKCECGKEIKKGDYGFVPVVMVREKLIFERAICKDCKSKRDQDGLLQPDPIALMSRGRVGKNGLVENR